MTIHDEKYLNIRLFSDSQKMRVYQKQGGRTVDENLQMLCQKCNNDKKDK